MYTAYEHEQFLTLVNRALSYFNALRILRSSHIGSYTEPKEILVHPQMGGSPGERAIVMVGEGHGAIGLNHAWTVEELKAGHIAWRVAHFSEEDRRLADADPTLAYFPAKGRKDGPEAKH